MTPARRSALLLAAAGAALAAYPALRGYGPETGLAAAELWARPAWLWAHQLGMAGFVLAGLGIVTVDRWAGRALLVGAVLVLPYYGAEAYGLHALGRGMLASGDGSAAGAADLFRYEPVAMTLFAAGWAAMAAAGVRLLRLAGSGIDGQRIGLVLVGLGLVTYLPQFFGTPGLRVAHGAVVGVGLALLALTVATRAPLARLRERRDQRAGVPVA
ncbi:hypothetical protein [Nocardioides alkalitolerans]|uniref:hypothetical protein n=1 Tax=Nocardioides alkalitolerans TaxID=281714 RepID=UPI00041A31D4|nr:hypothetical protein [Nocardioides alkalitolerans]